MLLWWKIRASHVVRTQNRCGGDCRIKKISLFKNTYCPVHNQSTCATVFKISDINQFRLPARGWVRSRISVVYRPFGHVKWWIAKIGKEFASESTSDVNKIDVARQNSSSDECQELFHVTFEGEKCAIKRDFPL